MTTRSNLLAANRERLPRAIIILVVITMAVLGLALLAMTIQLFTPGVSAANLVTGLLGMGSKTPWHLSRAAGTVAYLLLAGSTIWGLLLSSKIVKEAVPAALSLAMHNVLSWLALAFAGLHAVVLLLDNYYEYRLPHLVIPFIGPYRPGWVGLGIIGFYLIALLNISFQFRQRIGQKRWRTLHYLSFAVFVLATVHGIGSGTDSTKAGMQAVYIGSALLVLFLVLYRGLMSTAFRPRQPTR
ncbi:MAG: ferric reductase-like transmembrane domain-containing protein [Candidatus Promineifilaceae bacterium]